MVVFLQVYLEDKGALAKLVGTIRASDHRYDELHPHWEGSILGPKSVACIAKLEKAKVRTCHKSGLNVHC